MENSKEIPQKTKYRVAIWSSNPTPGYISRQTIIQKDTCAPVFIAALFTIAETQKQTKGPFTGEWIRNICICISTMEYNSCKKKKWNNAICNSMDGPRDYHSTKWSNSERQIHAISLICGNIKYDIKSMKQTQGHRETDLWLPRRREGGEGMD